MFSLTCLSAFAQDAFKSIDIHPDRSVTLRYRDAGAKLMLFAREGVMPVPMTKDEAGVWSVTTAPLEPDYYGYSFIADETS